MGSSPHPIPADFIDNAYRPIEDLVEQYGYCKDTLRKWRRALGIPKLPGGQKPAPLPSDFAEKAPGKSTDWLMKHYGYSDTVINRWRREAGVAMPTPAKDPAPADFVENAGLMHRSMLIRHYRRDQKIIDRWIKETGVEPQRYKAKGRPRRQTAAPTSSVRSTSFAAYSRTPVLPSGREEEAAQYLRRYYVGVYRCAEAGAADRDGKFWRCGAVVLTPMELVDRAKAKGYDPDAWSRIAA